MIDLSVNGTKVPVSHIEYRPGAGLVFRLVGDIEGLAAVGEGLSAAVRGGPYEIYRECCDSAPVKEQPHADECESASKRGKRR